MEEIEFSRWLFEGRLRQGKNVLLDGLNWLCYFAVISKSHRDNSIFFICLESPYQLDMKNIVKCYKHFFLLFPCSKNPRWIESPGNLLCNYCFDKPSLTSDVMCVVTFESPGNLLCKCVR